MTDRHSQAYKKRERDQRKSISWRGFTVKNREAGDPLRDPNPIKCQTCCDLPHRRMGVCSGCGLPYQAERIER